MRGCALKSLAFFGADWVNALERAKAKNQGAFAVSIILCCSSPVERCGDVKRKVFAKISPDRQL
ncbi:MAG TPA: hypothetical protein DEF05_05740 [Erwinia sp.]|nr:hypothetical protein [Erwinia sp.]